MELWDLYTRERELTGQEHIRGEAIPEGFYHLVVHVWIRSPRGEYLISQRSPDRPTFPLMWECVGGSVLKDEDSLTGALREVREEIGLDLSPADGHLLFSEIREHHRDIVDVWLFEYDGDVDLRDASTDETVQAVWMTSERIRELFDVGKLVHTLAYFFTRVSGLEAVSNFRLVRPSMEWKERYEEMMDEWEAFGGRLNPGALRRWSKSRQCFVSYEEWLRWIGDDRAAGQDLFFFADGERLIGAVSIRPRKSSAEVGLDGHSGYGIRPSKRRKGYAVKMLAMALPVMKELGIDAAIITCDKDNVGSAKTILKNGGVLLKEAVDPDDGNMLQVYRIELP